MPWLLAFFLRSRFWRARFDMRPSSHAPGGWMIGVGNRGRPVSTLSNLLAAHTALTGAAVAHLQRVVAEWQLLADLSFADFLLWVPVEDTQHSGEHADRGAGPSRAQDRDRRFLCVAQSRPTTTATAHPEDMVGATASASQVPQLERALQDAAMRREDQPRWLRGRSVRREVVPVRVPGDAAQRSSTRGSGEESAGGVVAVLGRDTNLAAPRVPSTLEVSYLAVAADLCQMVADGTFPVAAGRDEGSSTPRVGDGLVRLSSSGRVLYASPNAASAFHRLGRTEELVGADLATVVREVADDAFEAGEAADHLRGALAGTPSQRAELEGHGASAVLRALPLRPRGVPSGALVLVRDVTEVRRRDRALLSKDATIREIHHRVKNNLQTVAALLRLQARRIDAAEAKSALEEAVRRVGSIAIVHETLSGAADEQVGFDEIADRLGRMVTEVSATGEQVRVVRSGSFGVLGSDAATALAMVLTEVLQNAVEHGYGPDEPGRIDLVVTRLVGRLEVTVEDDGRGLPAGFDLDASTNLGLSIVRTLVESELGGRLTVDAAPSGQGARVVVDVPLA